MGLRKLEMVVFGDDIYVDKMAADSMIGGRELWGQG